MDEGLFGTDGIRGIPGEPPLVPDLVRRVAFAAGRQLDHSRAPERVAILGRDTRRSGPAIARQLAEGLAAAGFRVVSAGVIPTPGLAYLAARWGAELAAMVSASHNPAEFNGIKFLSADGLKLEPEREADIERRIAEPLTLRFKAPKIDDRAAAARRDYLDFLKSTFPSDLDLTGMRLVVDSAHGAASGLAAEVFTGLGAEVAAIGCRPTGTNINLGCGALDTAAMRSAVRRSKAVAGISLDGDADRCLVSDEKGGLLDGDALLAFLAESMKAQGLLRGDTVVATVMSNLGLLQHLKAMGVRLERVPVGDRHVTKALLDGGWSLGGEASGHIVLTRFAKTGDGLLTAIQTLAALRRSGRPLSRFRARFIMYPQVLQNLAVERKVPLEELPRFQRHLKGFQRRLGDKGRVYVRYSGTEPVLRLMAEGPRGPELRTILESLIQTYRKETGAAP